MGSGVEKGLSCSVGDGVEWGNSTGGKVCGEGFTLSKSPSPIPSPLLHTKCHQFTLCPMPLLPSNPTTQPFSNQGPLLPAPSSHLPTTLGEVPAAYKCLKKVTALCNGVEKCSELSQTCAKV